MINVRLGNKYSPPAMYIPWTQESLRWALKNCLFLNISPSHQESLKVPQRLSKDTGKYWKWILNPTEFQFLCKIEFRDNSATKYLFVKPYPPTRILRSRAHVEVWQPWIPGKPPILKPISKPPTKYLFVKPHVYPRTRTLWPRERVEVWLWQV